LSIAPALRVAAKAAAKASGKTVTITRTGETDIEDVSCGLGSSPFQTIGADGSLITIRSQDFLILAELYDFGDGPVEPQRGDLVTHEQDDGEHIYELLDIPGAPAWRFADAYQQRLRLHTNEITKPT
jgi:hypothetical protein